MAVPRAQQVIETLVRTLPERYEGYPGDLVEILNQALRTTGDGSSTSRRRKEVSESIRQKATQFQSGPGAT